MCGLVSKGTPNGALLSNTTMQLDKPPGVAAQRDAHRGHHWMPLMA